jgi:hypothetical protein
VAPSVWFAHFAPAETGPPLEGTVADAFTEKALPGVSVTFFTHQAVRYQAVTDASCRSGEAEAHLLSRPTQTAS